MQEQEKKVEKRPLEKNQDGERPIEKRALEKNQDGEGPIEKRALEKNQDGERPIEKRPLEKNQDGEGPIKKRALEKNQDGERPIEKRALEERLVREKQRGKKTVKEKEGAEKQGKESQIDKKRGRESQKKGTEDRKVEKEIIIEELGADNWKATTYFKMGIMLFSTFLACILVFFLVYRYQGLSANIGQVVKAGESIIIGLMLAYLLNPVMHFFETRSANILSSRMRSKENVQKISRVIGVAFSILILLLVIGFLIAAIVPAVVNSILSLVDTLPKNIEQFLVWIRQLDFGNERITDYVRSGITDATNYIEEWVTEKVLPEAQTYITQITSRVYSFVRSILNFVIGIIVAIYVMTTKEVLIGQAKKLLYALFRPKVTNMIIEITREADRIFGGFVKGKLLDSLIIGIICYIGCAILRIPDTILVAAVVGVTNVVPFFGPFIGAIPCIFLVLVQSPIHALYLGIFILVLQQVDGNIIGPKILGDSTGLSSFWVMFAILIGGGIFGFLGMLLGVPVMGVIYYLMRRITNYGVRKRGLTEKTDDYVYVHSVDEETNEMVYEEKETRKD